MGKGPPPFSFFFLGGDYGTFDLVMVNGNPGQLIVFFIAPIMTFYGGGGPLIL